MAIFEIKRNDNKPYLAVTLQDSTGSAIDLTAGSKISFNLADNNNTYTSVLSGAATITGSTAGQVEYRWATSDTARSGLYLGEFEVTFNDSTVLTLPTDHSLVVQINEDYDGS
tara:strand:+ start:86 stop:424 length:339 start_codon:yes stop_codon:yes gene_type:complete